MYCSACGMQLEETYSYCHRCGRPTRPDRTSPWGVPKTLSRPLWEKKISGVCAGFARYFDVDVTLMRILWLVVALVTGVGFIAYLVAWIAMPVDPVMRVPSTGSTPRQDAGPPPQQEPERPPAGDEVSREREQRADDAHFRLGAEQA